MKQYNYLLGQLKNGHYAFALWGNDTPLHHNDVCRHAGIDVVVSQGMLESGQPAYTLPEDQAEHQAVVDSLEADHYYTGSIVQWGRSQHIYIGLEDPEDAYDLQRGVLNLSQAMLGESGFTFDTMR